MKLPDLKQQIEDAEQRHGTDRMLVQVILPGQDKPNTYFRIRKIETPVFHDPGEVNIVFALIVEES